MVCKQQLMCLIHLTECEKYIETLCFKVIRSYCMAIVWPELKTQLALDHTNHLIKRCNKPRNDWSRGKPLVLFHLATSMSFCFVLYLKSRRNAALLLFFSSLEVKVTETDFGRMF